jgi:hypothetical protein
MLDKRDICEEIGNYFGTFYEDVAGFLTIDNGDTEYSYAEEDDLLKDWLPTLKEAEADTQDGTWEDIIEYIEEEIL